MAGSTLLPSPLVEGPIPITHGSLPLGSVAVRGSSMFVDLPAAGYVEEEYFISGTANVRLDSGAVVGTDLPYTTRVLVRRPSDPGRFSGNVHIEPLHEHLEHPQSWINSHEYFVVQGDAWVGVTVNSGVNRVHLASLRGGVVLLQAFDPGRYQSLEVASLPAEDAAIAPATGDTGGVQGHDIMAQLATLLKVSGPSSPLAAYAVEHVYASGWLHGGFWKRYLDNGHHDEARLADGRPVIEGYIVAVTSEPRVKPANAVVVSFLNEFDIQTGGKAMRGAGGVTDPDSDEPRFRAYEFPGSYHAWYADGQDNTSPMRQLVARGIPLAGRGHPDHPPVVHNHRSLWRAVHAVHANLDRWVRTGRPMPRAERITRDPNAADGLARDEHGNALGGVRTPWVDVPDAQYLSRCTCAPSRGALVPFPDEKLQALYGSRDEHTRRFADGIDRMVAAGWLLPADAAIVKATGE